MNIKKVSISFALAGVALHSAALTIGPAKGAAWIGRPLELSIPVIRDTQADTTALCVHADIYYAETLQDASGVHVQQESTDQADTVRLRLRSSTLIDEPVVTVNLRVGCEDRSVRRFVLLADLPVIPEIPVERALPEVAATTPATASETEAATARAPSARPAPEGTRTNATGAPPPKAGVASAPAPTHRPTLAGRSTGPRTTVAKVRPSAPVVKPPSPQRARLQLESVDILLERIKTLEAAAATPPPVETVSKDSERLQKLESDLQSLREQTAKNGATLLALQKQMERAETERVSTAWFYGLVALLMLCAVVIVMLWHRRRVPQAWNEGPSPEPESEPEPYEAQFLRKTADLELFEAPPFQMPLPKDLPEVDVVPGPEQVDLPVDVNLTDFDEPQWTVPDQSPTKRS